MNVSSSQIEDEEEDLLDDAPAAKVMYMTMPNRVSLTRLLSAWDEYKRARGVRPPNASVQLWDMFGFLKDLRRWSTQDRLEPTVTKYVAAMLEAYPDREVLIEFNFWYRANERDRAKALATLDEMLATTGGRRVDFVAIPEIGYQGALVLLPAAVARQLANAEGGLARLEGVMSIRPQSVYEPQSEATRTVELRDLGEPPLLTGPCVAAILDGYPVSAHSALAGRLFVHEVDVTSAQVPVSHRHHGTAMASLVLHGDLQAEQPMLSRRVSLIPVLTGDAQNPEETIPRERLAIGVIHRALQAIVNANPETHPDLANVTIVNHSLCDTFAPFARRPSPWAALLDYYAHEHRLLFVVSAGNIFSALPLATFNDVNDFEAATPPAREGAIITSLAVAIGQRGILSPAECINGLTVGAVHADESQRTFGNQIDPYPSFRMPNLASALGFGVNRSLKPDLLHDGGRFAVAAANTPGGGVSVSARNCVNVGQLVAAPSAEGDLTRTIRTAGTSNAAALVTRAGIQLADALDLAYQGEQTHWLERRTRAVILKALLAHGSSWGEIGRLLEQNYPPQDPKRWSARRDTVSKLLGYGSVDVSRVISGDHNRITLLADDLILHDKLHEYRLPIPQSMLRSKDLRAITITLAWSTPISPLSIDYRGVALRVVPKSGTGQFWKGVERDGPTQPNGSTAERGTLIHMRLSGDSLQRESVEGGIFVGVQSMARLASLKQVPIPYALAVTMELGQAVQSELYAQVQRMIELRAQQRETVRTGRN